jgi:tetratricopeptide (TPR) repeat protein
LTRKVLLIASLALCAFATPSLTSQNSSAASGVSFNQLLEAAKKARDRNSDDEAIRLFRRAAAEQPESEEALWYLGSMLYEKQQYSETRDVLRQFVTIRRDAGPAWALLGISEFQLREYPRALDHLQRAMAQGMGDRKEMVQSVFYDVAVLLIRFERFDDSMDMLLKLLASGTPDPALVEPAGLAGLRLALLPAEIPPDRRELVDMAGRAVVAMQTQHYEEAESEFKRLIAVYPNEPGVHFLYGAYLVQLHPNEAMPEFKRELEISPSHVIARIRLADQLITQRDFDDALTLVQQAIKLEPKRPSAHMLAGEALLAKGNSADGIKELEIARADDPNVSRVHWDLFRAYTSADRKEDANREKQEIERLLHSDSSKSPQNPGSTLHNSPGP